MERTLKHLIILLTLCITSSVFSQSWKLNAFLFESENIDSTELLQTYKNYDFSKIWQASKTQTTFGIIGEKHQRFYVQFLTVEKDSIHPEVYNVTGKTKVKNNVCDFEGHIYVQSIHRLKQPEFGVDDEYKGKTTDQGIINFEFEFFEDNTQNHSGLFVGYGMSKWYLDSRDQMQYDDIRTYSNGYCNNAFISKWQKHGASKGKVCIWGDYRVPMAHDDFDIGAGEFSPNEKYSENGWENYIKALSGNKEAQLKEEETW